MQEHKAILDWCWVEVCHWNVTACVTALASSELWQKEREWEPMAHQLGKNGNEEISDVNEGGWF